MKATIYKTDGSKESTEMTKEEISSFFHPNPISERELIGGKMYYSVDGVEDNPHFAKPAVNEEGIMTFFYPYKGDVIITTLSREDIVRSQV